MTTKHHFVLTKKEPELIAFITSLPKGERSKTVVTIMTEALEDSVTTIPMNFSIEPTEGLFHVFFEDDCGIFTVINTLCTLERAKQAAQEWLVDLVADALGVERSGKCADFLK